MQRRCAERPCSSACDGGDLGLGVGSWVRSLWHERLGGCGKVQYELAIVLVQPYLSLRAGVAGELARLAIVETPAAVADLDFPGPGPLSGEAGAYRDAQLSGTDRGVGISHYHQRACTRRRGSQDAPGHCLIAPQRHPHMQAALAHILTPHPQEHFDYGLHLVVGGIRAGTERS